MFPCKHYGENKTLIKILICIWFWTAKEGKGKTRLWLKYPVSAVLRCITTVSQENSLCLLKKLVLLWMFPRARLLEFFTGASGSFFVPHTNGSSGSNKAQRLGQIFKELLV